MADASQNALRILVAKLGPFRGPTRSGFINFNHKACGDKKFRLGLKFARDLAKCFHCGFEAPISRLVPGLPHAWPNSPACWSPAMRAMGMVAANSLPAVSPWTGLESTTAGSSSRGLAIDGCLLAASVKSALAPFHPWLLGAMVAAAPVSALLHASTMVKAGSYLVLRLSPALAETGWIGPVFALVGGFTFAGAALLALRQRDLKRILALSTVSSLGLIAASAGLATPAAVSAGALLLAYHAVAKPARLPRRRRHRADDGLARRGSPRRHRPDPPAARRRLCARRRGTCPAALRHRGGQVGPLRGGRGRRCSLPEGRRRQGGLETELHSGFRRACPHVAVHQIAGIIAPSTLPLEKEAEAGRFRKDLFYRLNVVTVDIPALKRRKEDIPSLAYHFMNKYSLKYGKHLTGISPDAIKRLSEYSWPANVRELEHIIEHIIEKAILFEAGTELTTVHLPRENRAEMCDDDHCFGLSKLEDGKRS